MISEIQTITRFLTSIIALETGMGAKESDVAEYYTTQYFYPVRDDFYVAKEFCIATGLVQYAKKTLSLSKLGKVYSNLGDKKARTFILEPNTKQKDFLSRKVFLISGLLDQGKKILYNFNKGRNGELYLTKAEAEVLKDQNLFVLLLQLGILFERKELIELAAQYAAFLEIEISYTVKVVTPAAFKKSEAEKNELSEIAEKYALKSESNRLKRLGAEDQLKKIDYVAIKNVAAGYDIASFNDKTSQDYDRFIEVKAGKSTPINFFLSRNEVETAKRLKARYYVYYVCVKDKKPQELYVFRDPIGGIMKDPKFTIRIDTYEITEK